MPSKALHLCNKPGCATLTRDRYCKKHEMEKNRYNRERNDKDIIRFYYSKEWQDVRELALKRDLYQCVRCRACGIVKIAEMVHHIVPIKKDSTKKLEMDNLESLCESCHNKVVH